MVGSETFDDRITGSVPGGKRLEATEAAGQGWGLMKRNLGRLLVLTIVYIVVSIAADRLIEFLMPDFLEDIVGWAAETLVCLGVIGSSLRILDGREIRLKEIYSSGARVGDFLLSQFLYVLIIIGGLILLVIPGIIWAVQFSFAGYLVLEEGLPPTAALKRSSALTRGSRTELVLLAVLLIGINILGALALVVGLFATIPTTWMAWTWAYRRLQGRAPDSTAAAPETGSSET